MSYVLKEKPSETKIPMNIPLSIGIAQQSMHPMKTPAPTASPSLLNRAAATTTEKCSDLIEFTLSYSVNG